MRFLTVAALAPRKLCSDYADWNRRWGGAGPDGGSGWSHRESGSGGASQGNAAAVGKDSVFSSLLQLKSDPVWL